MSRWAWESNARELERAAEVARTEGRDDTADILLRGAAFCRKQMADESKHTTNPKGDSHDIDGSISESVP